MLSDMDLPPDMHRRTLRERMIAQEAEHGVLLTVGHTQYVYGVLDDVMGEKTWLYWLEAMRPAASTNAVTEADRRAHWADFKPEPDGGPTNVERLHQFVVDLLAEGKPLADAVDYLINAGFDSASAHAWASKVYNTDQGRAARDNRLYGGALFGAGLFMFVGSLIMVAMPFLVAGVAMMAVGARWYRKGRAARKPSF
jgi:hypothetical protein